MSSKGNQATWSSTVARGGARLPTLALTLTLLALHWTEWLSWDTAGKRDATGASRAGALAAAAGLLSLALALTLLALSWTLRLRRNNKKLLIFRHEQRFTFSNSSATDDLRGDTTSTNDDLTSGTSRLLTSHDNRAGWDLKCVERYTTWLLGHSDLGAPGAGALAAGPSALALTLTLTLLTSTRAGGSRNNDRGIDLHASCDDTAWKCDGSRRTVTNTHGNRAISVESTVDEVFEGVHKKASARLEALNSVEYTTVEIPVLLSNLDSRSLFLLNCRGKSLSCCCSAPCRDFKVSGDCLTFLFGPSELNGLSAD